MKHRAAILALFAAAALLTGCQSQPSAHIGQAYFAPVDPLQNEQFSHTSPYVVLDSPGMRYAPADAAAPDAAPWWYDRNDARLNLRSSTGTSDSTTYAVQQIDRQQVSGGHINDNYQRNVYSWRVGRISQ